MKKKVSVYPLRLPASLKAAVAEISREEGTSINQFVAMAVAEKISAMKTAEFFTARGAEADIEAARRLLRRDGGQPPMPACHEFAVAWVVKDACEYGSVDTGPESIVADKG